MNATLKLVLAKRFGYIVTSPEYNKPHACFSFNEALDWMKQYNNSQVTHRGRWVAANHQF